MHIHTVQYACIYYIYTPMMKVQHKHFFELNSLYKCTTTQNQVLIQTETDGNTFIQL